MTQLTLCLRAALMAGVLLTLFDVAPVLTDLDGIGAHLLIFTLNLSVMLWLGIAQLLFRRLRILLGLLLRRRWAVAQAILVAAMALPLLNELFEGPGVSQSWLGTVAPPLLTLVVGAVAWLHGRFGRALRYTTVGMRWLWAWVHLALSITCALLDRKLLIGLYPLLHSLLALGASVCMLIAADTVLKLRNEPRDESAVTPVRPFTTSGLLTLLLLWIGVSAMLWVFPRHANDRAVLLMGGLFATHAQTLQAVIDLDGDGFSTVLGGSDCADRDARRHPLALELAGNGIDENCDGSDEARPLPPQGYTQQASHRQRLLGRAWGKPTVLLIVDALRVDRLQSPRFAQLHAMANASLRFDHCLAPSASTATVLMALSTARLRPVAQDVTLFQLMQQQGKRSAYAGLDVLVGYLERNLSFPALRGIDHIEPVRTRGGGLGWGSGVDEITAPQVTQQALALLEGPQPPDLLIVHYFDLHQWQRLFPDDEPVAAYDKTLDIIDRELAHWWRQRERLNLVLIGDHGEFLGEHGKLLHTRVLARELVHVPLLLSLPRAEGVALDDDTAAASQPATTGGQVAEVVGLIDLAPTLAELLGVSPVPEGWPARSLLGVAPGALLGERAVLGVERDQLSLALDGWRLIYDRRFGAQHLYDLRADPNEQADLAARHSDVVLRLNRLLFDLCAVEGVGR